MCLYFTNSAIWRGNERKRDDMLGKVWGGGRKSTTALFTTHLVHWIQLGFKENMSAKLTKQQRKVIYWETCFFCNVIWCMDEPYNPTVLQSIESWVFYITKNACCTFKTPVCYLFSYIKHVKSTYCLELWSLGSAGWLAEVLILLPP